MHNINLSFTNNLLLPTFFNDINLGLYYTLNWINENIIQCAKPSIFLVTLWTATDNIKKHNIFIIIT